MRLVRRLVLPTLNSTVVGVEEDFANRDTEQVRFLQEKEADPGPRVGH